MEKVEKYAPKLPSINDLYSEKVILSRQNDLNLLLNQEPKKEWLKQHPIADNVKYIPIGRVEWLLTNIFVKWKVEILREGIIANSVYVIVRVHYLDPITNSWEWIDGCGACPLQTDKEAGAADFTKIKSDSVMKALPAAESYAVKDAVEKLGKLFGKDLNRKDQIGYEHLIGKFVDEELSNELYIRLETFERADELKQKTTGLVEEFVQKGLSKGYIQTEIQKRNNLLVKNATK